MPIASTIMLYLCDSLPAFQNDSVLYNLYFYLNFLIQIIMIKFQKILVLLYVVGQFAITSSIINISEEVSINVVLAIITLLTYFAVFFKDPGYLIIDQAFKAQFGRQFTDFSDQQNVEDQEYQGGKPTCKRINISDEIQKKNQEKNKNDEKRVCRICQINQPFRMKHCHECEMCVATFDHHCPWMNTCIGEKNRPIFLVYLTFQTLQFLFGGIYVCDNAIKSRQLKSFEWIFGVVLIMLLFFLLGLLIFHFYLMVSNITTWEFARWETIVYLKDTNRVKGSPFSKGKMRNIMEYWEWGFRKNRKIWEFDISA